MLFLLFLKNKNLFNKTLPNEGNIPEACSLHYQSTIYTEITSDLISKTHFCYLLSLHIAFYLFQNSYAN
jgi:hypothetical protein